MRRIVPYLPTMVYMHHPGMYHSCTTLGIPCPLLYQPATCHSSTRGPVVRRRGPGLREEESPGYEAQRGLLAPKGVMVGMSGCAELLLLPG